MAFLLIFLGVNWYYGYEEKYTHASEMHAGVPRDKVP